VTAELAVDRTDEAPSTLPTRRRSVGRRRKWRQEQSAWSGLVLSFPFIVLAGAFIVYPFVRLVKTAIGEPNGVDNFKSFFHNSANLRVLRITFVDAAIVTVIAVALGALVAWSVRTTTSRAMKLLLLASIFVPFWMGSVTKLYAFTVLLERLGVVNRVLLDLHVIGQPLTLIYNQLAVEIGMVYQMLPYSVLPLYVGFLSIDLDLIYAAQSLGASRARALRTIVLPLALPSTLATVTIVYVVSIGFYLTPVLLGGVSSPFSASLISQDIFTFFDLPDAAVTAVLLLAGALVVITIGYLVVGKDRLRRALG
jgi:putative spermidine/putrescine transport system permease protein